MSEEQPPYLLIASDVKLGERVRVNGFTNRYGCEIGNGTQIATIVGVSSHSFICEGVTIKGEIFVGHTALPNDDCDLSAATLGRRPQGNRAAVPAFLRRGASVVCSAGHLAEITIGERALVGAGRVVTTAIPRYAALAGNPDRALKELSQKH